MHTVPEEIIMKHHVEQISRADGQRFDANETAFLERELTQLRSRVMQVEHNELLATRFIPLATDIAASANTYSFKVTNFTGKATVIANAAADLPDVELSAFERTGKVYPLGASYQFEKNELAEAARTGVPIGQQKTNAARYVVDEGVDLMLAYGKPEGDSTNLVTTGFYNSADVAGAADARVVAGTFWDLDATAADDVIEEMSSWVAQMGTQSNMRFMPDTIVFAQTEYMYISQKKVGNDADTTVLTWFLRNNPWIQNIFIWFRGTAQGADSVKNRTVIYKRNSMVLEGIVPQGFTQEPPQLKNLASVTNCTARAGGVRWYQPLAALYVDHATS